MEYFFLLGRNPSLSIAEIFSYFEKEGISVKYFFEKENALLVDVDKNLDVKKLIERLGGVVAVGVVACSGTLKEILEKIKKEEIYFGEKIKFNYSILDFSESGFDKIHAAIKEKFKKEKLKARYKDVRGKIKLQNKKIIFGTPSKLKSFDVLYFIFKNKDYHFGFIEEIYNPKAAGLRDMGKPIRREEFALSPRLAKILINLSQVKEKEILADPFCGVGIILQEALLQGINVVGIDVDKKAILSSQKNLEWLKHNYNISGKYELINSDSRKVFIREVDGIATEPFLGKLFKKTPNEKEVSLTLKNYEELMISVLNNIKKFLKKRGKISFTAPLIKLGKKRVGCDINKICKKTGLLVYKLKNVSFPIKEFRENQIVGREFYVLVKS